MGKDTGSNRKSGRAGAQAPAQTPAVGVTPATKLLASKDAGAFAKGFAENRYGTTSPSELESEWGVKVNVDPDGVVSLSATTKFSSAGAVNALLTNTRQDVVNYAKSNGFLAEVISESTKGKTVSVEFKIWGA